MAQPLSFPLPMAQGAAKPLYSITPTLLGKVFVAIVCGVMALYLLNTGRRENSPEKLFWGALAALASIFVFLL